MRHGSGSCIAAFAVAVVCESARWLLHRPHAHPELGAALLGIEAGAIAWLVATLERSRRDAELRLMVAIAERDAAEEAGRAKQEFLARVTHEWRGPLNTMSNWVWQLERRSAEPQFVAIAVASLQRAVAAQRRMVSDLLDYSRGASGKLSMDFGRVDIHDVVGKAMEAVAAVAARKDIAVELSADSSGHFVRGDAIRLEQVFANILDNAAKFTPQRGRIAISIRRRQDALEVTVTDTGVGIAPDALPEIFEPFTQTQAERDAKRGGLGLGLSIARQIVELHGGWLTATSTGPSSGSVFSVVLPELRDRSSEHNRDVDTASLA